MVKLLIITNDGNGGPLLSLSFNHEKNFYLLVTSTLYISRMVWSKYIWD